MLSNCCIILYSIP